MKSDAQFTTPAAAEQWLKQSLGSRFAEAIEAMTDNRPTIEPAEPEDDAKAAADRAQWLWWKQALDVADDALIWTGAPKATWLTIGQQALAAAGLEDAEEEDIQGTYRELLQQALSSVAQDLGARLGKDVACTEGEVAPQAPSPAGSRLLVRFPDQDPFPVEVTFTPGLSQCLVRRTEPDAGAEPNRGALTTAAGQQSSREETPAEVPDTIQVLLDVELPVSISLGRAHLPLKDVLKLTSGSIVELNRSVNEPVEVIVNNCVIARGEVVVVDGNYGIRINQIISRRERLRTLN